MSQAALAVTNLSKHYQTFTAVDGISFSVHPGEIVGLLGPNGAGKTTTIQMLLGLTTADGGTIEYFGQDFTKHREESLKQINFASAYSKLQAKLTVRQDLRIFGGLYEVPNIGEKIKEVAALLEIEPYLDTLFWKLSSGQQARAVLAKALLNDPRLILMDEPTSSMDPDIVNKMIDLIRTMKNERNMAILFTSHNMEEVTRLCDRVIFLHHGKIVAEDTPLGLTKQIDSVVLAISFDGPQAPMDAYCTEKNYAHRFIQPQLVEVKLPEKEVPAALFGLSKHDIWVTNIDIAKPTLEDVFIRIARGEHHELA
jgi:ABC-2 type transport system ATP-binding protein